VAIEVEWLDAIQFGITTGLVGGLANQGFGMLREKLERNFRRDERQAVEQSAEQIRLDERRHQAILRREAAHDAARQKFLPMAEDLLAWADWEAHEAHADEGGDFHYVGAKRTTISDEGEAIRMAREIATGHPSKHVREKADALYNKINVHYGEFRPNGNYAPTFDDVYAWMNLAEELVELVHTPADEADLAKAIASLPPAPVPGPGAGIS
jgi:hypothetical protein